MSRRYTLEESCTVLDVHPKTFKRWLKDDHITTERSKADKRIKFLTEEQVKQLAELHDKPWPPPVSQEAEVIPVAAYKLLIERMTQVEQQTEQISNAQATLEAAIAELRKLQEDAIRPDTQASASQELQLAQLTKRLDTLENQTQHIQRDMQAQIEQAAKRLQTQFQSDLATLRQEFERQAQDVEQDQTHDGAVLSTQTEQPTGEKPTSTRRKTGIRKVAEAELATEA